VVTICTTSLTFSNSTFCPYSVFLCFVWIWEQTAIISLYSINWLVCITERKCVTARCVHTHVRTNVFRTELLQKAVTEPSRHASTVTWNISVIFLHNTGGICGAPNTHRALAFHGSFTFSSFHYENIISAAMQRHCYLNKIIISLNITVVLVNESQLDSLWGMPLWQRNSTEHKTAAQPDVSTRTRLALYLL
jgi:hypothetical protein